MAVIPVNAPDGAYDIVIEPGLLQSLHNRHREMFLNGKVVVVTNPTLQNLYSEPLDGALPGISYALMLDGERYKTLNTVQNLYGDFIDAGLDRSGTVLAFGGGVVGDTAGFAAATYMRGIRFVQMPTSLLAMVDSSVGAKVGVDLPQGKNLVGAFKQPERVLIDPDMLKTLSHHQWQCGMAEVIKHGFLADERLLDPSLYQPERAAELIERAVRVKVEVVQRDPYEKGERTHLNLGHTFGHAIEQVTNYHWLHGEAVAVGLIAAARLSHNLSLCDASVPALVEDILTEIGLPTMIEGIDPERIYAAMGTDKKWVSGKSRFVLLRGVGLPTIVEDVPREEVLRVLKSLQ
ncbi:MAG TPA: 3-dehydroquinate synthase [Phototrophicaceae bacterium]|jgi:3-dehydroquinate synthase|nr:3-dehydroquinate synthase [Phototrophicaceae bacterium]